MLDKIHTDDKIAAGKYSVVYISPERFMGKDQWRATLQTDMFLEQLVGLVFDEVHTVIH